MNQPAKALHAPIIDPKAQQRAASDPGVSAWVNASAGSGKTTILTDRVTRLLLSGVAPQKILCLTFTRAAAAEMALRVTSRLSFWAVCSDNELSASLDDLQGRPPSQKESTRARRLFAEVLACPGGMRIRTLHGFGQEILRRFPVESGLPPHFAVIEEDEARRLQDECLTGLLRDGEAADAAGLLIERLGEKAFREAARQVLREKARLAHAVAKAGGLEALVARMRGALNLQPEDTEENLIGAAFKPAVFDEGQIREAAKLLLKGLKNSSGRGDKILRWLGYDQGKRVALCDEYIGGFLKKDGDFFKDYADKKLRDAHPQLEEILRTEAQRLSRVLERCEAVRSADMSAAVVRFGQALIARYGRSKRLRAALDYDDLVDESLNLLRRPGIAPWILHKLDDGLDHLLVDEAQDTSRAQWDIVALLAGEFFAGSGAHANNRTLFVVGDEKQSIYSFQNADPEAFAAMRDYFKTKIDAAEKKWDEIPLHVSFRSAPAVLRAVDAVFADPAAQQGVSAAPVEHASFKREKLFGRVELWPLLPQPEAKVESDGVWDLPIGYESERDPEAELADRIAATIKNWLAKQEVLPGEQRAIRPGDIMILLRRRGRFADLMVRALKKKPHDVPVTGVDRMRLMEQLPVMDLLALVQFVLLPENNLNLANVLRSPLMNLSEEDLMGLAAGRGEVSLWQSLKNAAADGTAGAEQSRRIEAGGKKLEPIHDYLARWLGQADFMTPFAMLARILSEPCPAHAVSGKRALWARLGLDALDPVDELLNAAQNFSRRHAPSLQNFLHWLGASDSEIKRELDHGDDGQGGQVRIMTVHASKGLEAPIVFLPDTVPLPRVQDVPKFLWSHANASPDAPLSLPFYVPTKPGGGYLRNVWNRARQRQMEEYRRLLYVALTRASHRLYIGGWEPRRKEGDGESSWYNLVKNGLKESEAHARDADGGMIVWEDPALAGAVAIAPKKPAPIAVLPDWALRAAPLEIVAEVASPSKLAGAPSAATPDQAFVRGRILHRLLQSLPDVEDARRDDIAAKFLAQPRHGLNEAQQKEMRGEILHLLRDNDFAPLFGAGSSAEVPIAGIVAGRKIAGQVDRLALVGDEVWVVDYKTNRPPPDNADAIPPIYRAQMEAYRNLLQAVYPGKKVRCFLLWTYGARLMEVVETVT